MRFRWPTQLSREGVSYAESVRGFLSRGLLSGGVRGAQYELAQDPVNATPKDFVHKPMRRRHGQKERFLEGIQ